MKLKSEVQKDRKALAASPGELPQGPGEVVEIKSESGLQRKSRWLSRRKRQAEVSNPRSLAPEELKSATALVYRETRG